MADKQQDTVDLLRRVAAGQDEQAWEQLVGVHGPRMYSTALAVTGARDLAEDAV